MTDIDILHLFRSINQTMFDINNFKQITIFQQNWNIFVFSVIIDNVIIDFHTLFLT